MRLHRVLDDFGFSPRLLDRSRSLGDAIGVDAGTASSYLTGHTLPPWDDFFTICAFSKRQPSYFLDDTDAREHELPSDTRLIQAMGIGGDMVLRLPETSITDSSAAKSSPDWAYLQAQDELGYGVVPGDYVINFPSQDLKALRSGQLCVLEISGRYQVRKCVSRQKRSAQFTTRPGVADDTLIQVERGLRIAGSRSPYINTDVDYIGVVTAIIRPVSNDF